MSLVSSTPIAPAMDRFPTSTVTTEDLNYAPNPKSCLKSPPGLRRYQTVPMNQKSPGKRRSIFGKELSSGGLRDLGRPSPPPTPPQHKRSLSVGALPSPDDQSNRSFLVSLSRPLSGTIMEQRPHFCDHTRMPENLLEKLPNLPTPLRRFYNGSRCSYLEGMYPLVRPSSILRHKESSEDSLEENIFHSSSDFHSSGDLKYQSSNNHALPAVPPPSALNLTQSLKLVTGLRASRQVSCSSEDTGSTASNSSHSTSQRRKVIRFDPRVTVTEFEDDPEYRQWFSDFELETFKKETIALAQQYLVKHPLVLQDYCKPYLDPVTGTCRKKALFSMLVLKATRSEDSLDELESENSSKRYDEMRQDLADTHFQKILLVNHNKLVLDLFERSLIKIFPKASFTRHERSDDALESIHRSENSFDLIVAEDRSHRPWKSCDGLDVGDTKNAPPQGNRNFFQASKIPSVEGLTRVVEKKVSPSVCELFRVVRALERFEKRETAMLIAVSTQAENIRSSLQAIGADAVWSLPPPLMSEALRDELVARLIQRRRAAAKE